MYESGVSCLLASPPVDALTVPLIDIERVPDTLCVSVRGYPSSLIEIFSFPELPDTAFTYAVPSVSMNSDLISLICSVFIPDEASFAIAPKGVVATLLITSSVAASADSPESGPSGPPGGNTKPWLQEANSRRIAIAAIPPPHAY